MGGKEKRTGSDGPKGPGRGDHLARGLESPTPLASLEPLPHLWASLFLLALLFSRPSSFSFLGDLSCYILLSSAHPPPTLINHPCLSLSARPIGHSLWRSVSCCGPHRPVQGSHPHQCGQGVSCGYLIRNWWLLLGLSPHHSPMASPCDLESLLRSSSGLPRATWRFSLPWFWPAEDGVVLGSTFWQSRFPSFVPEHFFLLGVGLGLEMEWAEASRTFWPYNSPSKSCYPAPRTGRRTLTFSDLNHGRLSLVSLWVPGFLRLAMACSWRFGVWGASSLMLSFWG